MNFCRKVSHGATHGMHAFKGDDEHTAGRTKVKLNFI